MHLRKIAAVLAALTLALPLSACETDEPTDETYLNMQYVSGWWRSARGDLLWLDAENGKYSFETFYGRGGEGDDFSSGEDGRALMYYAGFNYTFTLNATGKIIPHQNGSSAYNSESLDGIEFTRDGTIDVEVWSVDDFAGTWRNILGDEIVIDTDKGEYTAMKDMSFSFGAISDERDGLGAYLYMFCRAYLIPSADGNSFSLLYIPMTSDETPGDITGVFYRDGDTSGADLAHASYREDENGVWYSDGVNSYFLGEGWTIAEDGCAYNEGGVCWLPLAEPN